MLTPGQSGFIVKTITKDDISAYASIVGDSNPIHLNESVAKEKGFDRCIAHGMLTGSLISTVLGTIFPGEGTIYLEQNLRFLKPVYEGEECKAVATLIEILKPDKGIYRLKTEIYNSVDECVIDGFAVVKYSS